MRFVILLFAFIALPGFAQTPAQITPAQKTAIEDFQKKNAQAEADKKACRATAINTPASSPTTILQERALVYAVCMTKLGHDVQ